MASILLMVDKPPFVDPHSLPSRATLSFLFGARPDLLLSPSCDAENGVLEKDGSCNKHEIKVN